MLEMLVVLLAGLEVKSDELSCMRSTISECYKT